MNEQTVAFPHDKGAIPTRGYVKEALYIYTEDGAEHVAAIVDNPFGVSVSPVPYETLRENHNKFLAHTRHVVISANLQAIKHIFLLAMEYRFSIGLLPTPRQKTLIKVYGLPKEIEAQISLSLRDDAQPIDIVFCNNSLLLFKATVGNLPLLDSPADAGKLKLFFMALKQLAELRFHPLSITVQERQKIETAGSGCIILQYHENTLASRLIAYDSAINDGMISLVVSSPLSVVDYFKFLYRLMTRKDLPKKTLPTTGYIKCPEIRIETKEPLPTLIDGEETIQQSLYFKVRPEAVRLNTGKQRRKKGELTASTRGKIHTETLPTGKELAKTRGKRIPFFPFATEEHFKNLFVSLRADARTNSIYLILIVLSTMLATIGLYQSSSAVMIGAMLLAPLMAPIVSLAMGILRQETNLTRDSLVKIAVGTGLALLSAAIVALIFPYKPITPEMQARLHPSLLDLAVALISGVAGAYAKSHKEIIESLAGVAIAVALIPPLAVAGIGIGIWNFHFFSQAFLLFLTNLVGIILAGAITFRILGYSTVVRNKKGLLFVGVATLIIAIPLFLATRTIIHTFSLEKRWKQERFLVNDKYLIIKNTHIDYQKNQKILYAKVMTRSPLNRDDLNRLREKIQSNFPGRMKMRVEIIYIP